MARPHPAGIVFLAGLAGLVSAGCTSMPTPSELLNVGWRSPEQCFAAFQIAVRADEPQLEYRCFSQHFRAENHVSQWAWREFREELWSQFGSRWAVAKAEPRGPARVHGDRAEMLVRALGKNVRLHFVREEFGQIWGGETLLADAALDFHAHSGAQEGLFYGQVPLPPDCDPNQVTELRLGLEWKLDLIRFEPDP